MSLAGRSRGAIVRFALVVVLLLAADLVSKHEAFQHVAGTPVSGGRDASGQLPTIPPHDATIVVPRVLALRLTYNQGAVFGLGQGGRWAFVAFTVVAGVVVLVLFVRTPARAWGQQLALAGILAGGLGNLHDRLFVGAVRDMLLLFPDVRLPFGWRWPGGADGLYPWIFNVADVCLVLGIGTLLVASWRTPDEKAAASAK